MKVGHCGCDQQDVNPPDTPLSPIPSETQPEVFSSSHSYFPCMGFAVKLMIFSWKSLWFCVFNGASVFDWISLLMHEVRSCAYEELIQIFKGDFRSLRFVLGQVQIVAINLGLDIPKLLQIYSWCDYNSLSSN
jgi:hypothetical protein